MKHPMRPFVLSAFGLLAFCSVCLAQSTSGVIEGKNDWLFPGWDSLKHRKLEGEKGLPS